jgi:hypothetical protein
VAFPAEEGTGAVQPRHDCVHDLALTLRSKGTPLHHWLTGRIGHGADVAAAGFVREATGNKHLKPYDIRIPWWSDLAGL